jgi:hypothetical protein
MMNPTDEQILRQCLEKYLTRQFGERSAIAGLKREPATNSTSFAADILYLSLESGQELKLFLKEFGSSRLPKDDRRQRAAREVRVYRELLDKCFRLHKILKSLGNAVRKNFPEQTVVDPISMAEEVAGDPPH